MEERTCNNCCFGIKERNESIRICAMHNHEPHFKDTKAIDIKCKKHLFRERKNESN